MKANTCGTMASRGLRPASELAANREHGDRLRYIGGCRCDCCRRANTEYEQSRAKARKEGDWNGIVSAAPARKHIDWLSYHGVGRRAVGAATDVADSILTQIINGTRTQIRARTEKKILAVTLDAAADHALVPAGSTWKLIAQLLKAGFTKTQIAFGLGRQTHALQIGKKAVTVRNAFDVRKLHAKLINSEDALVAAQDTWRLIGKLRAEGYTDKQLARELGFSDGHLQVPKARVTRKLARIVTELYERAMS